MSNEFDDYTLGVLVTGKPTGTIEVKPHPEDVIEVDPEILAIMNAKLRGESFDDVYDKSDRVTKEFLIRKEADKLRRIFASAAQVFQAFSSLTNLKEIRKELQFEEVNRDLLAEYSLKKYGGSFLDEVDVYASVLTGGDPFTKKHRSDGMAPIILKEPSLLPVYLAIKDTYLSGHFEPLGVSKELIQLKPSLQTSLKSGRLIDEMNTLLSLFYREVA